MRTETQTVRIGEWFFDGSVEDWLATHERSGVRPLTEKQIAFIHDITGPGGERGWGVERSSGVIHRIISVGLYDGWAYWCPRLCLLVAGTLGVEVVEMYEVRYIYKLEKCNCPKNNHRILCRGFRAVRGE